MNLSRRVTTGLVLMLGLCLLALAPAYAGGPQIIYVNVDAVGFEDGTSWANAYPSLHDALSEADWAYWDNDETPPVIQIWVAAGTYYTSDELGGQCLPGPVGGQSFSLVPGVKVYGGFAGGEGALDARNPAVNVTILDGDGVRTVVVADGGNYGWDDLSWSEPGVNMAGAVLDGFTIQNGWGDALWGGCGGGMFNYGVTGLTINNCVFNANYAESGAGMFNAASAVTITNCTFSENVADDAWGGGSGGGMYNDMDYGYYTDEGWRGWVWHPLASSTLTNCTFEDNEACFGGGMYNDWLQALTLTNCTFTSNDADDGYGGGIYNYDTTMTATGCTFDWNWAYWCGGGIYQDSDFWLSEWDESEGWIDTWGGATTLTNCDFLYNSAENWDSWDGYGGGIYSYEAAIAATNCDFTGNYAYYGGGVYNDGAKLTATGCTFADNDAGDYGGGVYNYGCYWAYDAQTDNYYPDPSSFTNCTFTGNYADWEGGGMYNYETALTLTGCTFSANEAWYGGGMCNVGWFEGGEGKARFAPAANMLPGPIEEETLITTLTNCTFTGNAAYMGGGMWTEYVPDLLVDTCTFTQNTAGCGGAMFNAVATLTIVDSSFSSNAAVDFGEEDGWGGAIYNYAWYKGGDEESSTTITNCTFSANEGEGVGGAIIIIDCYPVLTNCTFSGNLAEISGGAAAVIDDAWPQFVNCTFSGNNSNGDGGALGIFWGGWADVLNCILWGNTADEGKEIYCAEGSGVDVSYSCVQGGEYDEEGEGNISADPQLEPLADNGGPVQTMALGGGSPCIDAGDFLGGNAPTTDARGTARPSGIGYDMGAYEYGAGFLDLRINGELFEPYDANATIGGIAYGAITYGATPVVLTGTLMVGGQAPSGAVLISISRASIKGEVLPVTITQQRVLVNSLTGAFSAKFDSRTYPASEGTDSQGVGKTWYYLITYRFGDLSATRELLVQKADPLFSRLSPPDGTSGLLGGARRATGTIKHPNGRLVPTGKVTVTMSGTGREASLSGSIMAGLGTFSVSFTAAMLPKDTTYTITYYYPGDANYNPLQAAPGPR